MYLRTIIQSADYRSWKKLRSLKLKIKLLTETMNFESYEKNLNCFDQFWTPQAFDKTTEKSADDLPWTTERQFWALIGFQAFIILCAWVNSKIRSNIFVFFQKNVSILYFSFIAILTAICQIAKCFKLCRPKGMLAKKIEKNAEKILQKEWPSPDRVQLMVVFLQCLLQR